MQKAPVIILVGDSDVSMIDFYSEFTRTNLYAPITDIRCKSTTNTLPTMVLAITPALQKHRDHFMYSWGYVFNQATIILNFGGWTVDEINGIKPYNMPPIMTWSGDGKETMQRILAYVNKE